MVTAVWSMKGGVGVTAVACMLGIAMVERAEPTVIVDLAGDIPAVLGMAPSEEPGLADWYATPSRSSNTLARIRRDVVPDLQVIARGVGDLTGPATALDRALDELDQVVIVDCGTLSSQVAVDVASSATQRLVVARPCYLALQALRSNPVAPSAVVMLDEKGRALGRTDVEAVAGAPVVAKIAVDVSIARALDAGLIATRLPRALVRSLGSVIAQ